MGKRARRVALHPARRALAQRIRRIVQLPSARRMPEHQHLLVPDPGPGRHRRLEARLQPLPPPLLAGLFTTSPLRCQLYPPMTGSHPLRTSSRGPATPIGPAERDRCNELFLNGSSSPTLVKMPAPSMGPGHSLVQGELATDAGPLPIPNARRDEGGSIFEPHRVNFRGLLTICARRPCSSSYVGILRPVIT